MRGMRFITYQTSLGVLCALLCSHKAIAITHDSPEAAALAAAEAAASTPAADSVPIYTDGTGAPTPATLTQTASQSSAEDPQLKIAAEELGRRIGDLFACVPGRMDDKFSTQSWYLLNSFLSFNNSVARSTFANDKGFSDELKKSLMLGALGQIKGRNPGLEEDAKIQAYFEGVASTAEILFKNALTTRETYRKSTDMSSLVAKSHAPNDTSVLEKLKAAHSAHSSLLKRKDCVGIKARFWETPYFALPGNPPRPAPNQGGSASPSKTTPTKKPEQSSGSHQSKINPETAMNASEIDAKYGRSKRISTQLPYSSWDDRKTNGYHTYYGTNGYLWGRPYVIGNIMKAANVLKNKGIFMGVGDINRKPYTAYPYHRETPGHGSHDQGRAVDLRLIGPDGEARRCTVEQPECYDRGKTFEMIRALIDADPKELRVIYINDPKLRKMLEDYLVSTHGYSRLQADDAVQYWPCHDNHVHFHWKDDYSKR